MHRDLKPANVFVTRRGQSKILDFGRAKLSLAKVTADSTARTADGPLTQVGATVGTISFMSPEQARGRPIDARSDLFSLGLVLYEMTTGRPAFPQSSPVEVFDALLNRQPPAPRELNPRLPPGLKRLIQRLMEKEPDRRCSSASELLRDLKRLGQDASYRATLDSIVVLPFVNAGGDADTEYLSDGLADTSSAGCRRSTCAWCPGVWLFGTG